MKKPQIKAPRRARGTPQGLPCMAASSRSTEIKTSRETTWRKDQAHPQRLRSIAPGWSFHILGVHRDQSASGAHATVRRARTGRPPITTNPAPHSDVIDRAPRNDAFLRWPQPNRWHHPGRGSEATVAGRPRNQHGLPRSNLNAQNNGVNKTQPQVVEPWKATAAEHQQFRCHEGVQGSEGPDADGIREVNREVATDENPSSSSSNEALRRHQGPDNDRRSSAPNCSGDPPGACAGLSYRSGTDSRFSRYFSVTVCPGEAPESTVAGCPGFPGIQHCRCRDTGITQSFCIPG